jgi:capsular exopolysaccharide synthesis family protein
VATNLAIALAQGGERVILIDADMRRPQVHALTGLAQEPGLSNLIVGTAKAADTITSALVPGLWVLPAGQVPPNPVQLLSSTRFRELLKQVEEKFDWVIIDSPPVMAVADSGAVAHIAGGVLFVVGAEMSGRRTVQDAVGQLDSLDGRFLGAVLNRVDVERNAYYYSHYYKREYRDYYSSAPSSR